MPYQRIVSVQGPFNLLAALSHLFSERSHDGSSRVKDDILVVHGVFAGEDTRSIHAIISDMARAWPWKKVVYLDEFEKRWVKSGSVNSVDVQKSLHHEIGVTAADELMIVRNWQDTNELLLKSFPAARKILYGDAFGQVDSYAGSRFECMDEGRFLLPVRYFPYSREETVIETASLPYRVTPRHFVVDVIRTYLEISPEARSLHAAMARDAQKKLILLTKNAAESRVSSLETEISIYVEAVRRVTKPGITVIIKPHPRESLRQSLLVQRALQELHGIHSEIVGAGSYLGHMPVEILCSGNNFHAVLAPLVSVTCRQLKYLYGIDSYEPLTDEMLARINPARGYHYLATDLVNRETVYRLDKWDGEEFIYEWNPQGAEERKQLSRLGSWNSQWPQLRRLDNSDVVSALKEFSEALQSATPDALVMAARKLIALEPNDSALFLTLGDLVYQAGDIPSAIRAFEIATIIDPSNTATHEKLSRIALETGNNLLGTIARICAGGNAPR